ncbi:hypothetical protein LINPERHAP1_LOCUS15490, partial [Linum perenne]
TDANLPNYKNPGQTAKNHLCSLELLSNLSTLSTLSTLLRRNFV